MTNTLLDTRQAAEMLGLSPKCLERWRVEGAGPAYIKAGPGKRARVRYRQADLDIWLEANRFTSTSAYSATAASRPVVKERG
ncbi:MAG: helix-turn-helix domain-containing protein [Hyphomicrobiaceae bacterium]